MDVWKRVIQQIIGKCLVVLLVAGLWACDRRTIPEVVVYTSVDDVFARPVARHLSKRREPR